MVRSFRYLGAAKGVSRGGGCFGCSNNPLPPWQKGVFYNYYFLLKGGGVVVEKKKKKGVFTMSYTH